MYIFTSEMMLFTFTVPEFCFIQLIIFLDPITTELFVHHFRTSHSDAFVYTGMAMQIVF